MVECRGRLPGELPPGSVGNKLSQAAEKWQACLAGSAKDDSDVGSEAATT